MSELKLESACKYFSTSKAYGDTKDQAIHNFHRKYNQFAKIDTRLVTVGMYSNLRYIRADNMSMI